MTDPLRESPTWRIPFGIIALFLALMVYAIAVARYAPDLIGRWPGWAQTIVYLFLGVIWLLPLKRFLIWMETGRWSPPEPLPDPDDDTR